MAVELALPTKASVELILRIVSVVSSVLSHAHSSQCRYNIIIVMLYHVHVYLIQNACTYIHISVFQVLQYFR